MCIISNLILYSYIIFIVSVGFAAKKAQYTYVKMGAKVRVQSDINRIGD